MIRAIYIHNASNMEDSALRLISPKLQEIFHVPVHIQPMRLDLDQAYDGVRGQYLSTQLISELQHREVFPDSKHLLLVDVDLFVPVLTFIFGEAQLAGQFAIVSTHRLHNDYYGLPGNPQVLHERLEKEIVHELGHTFGLFHCHQFECVMRASTYVEEIDLKRCSPCSRCQTLLHSTHQVTISN